MPNVTTFFSIQAEKTDKMGCLKVDNFLQVEGITDVYAIGDCCNTPEIKVATGAQSHGEFVASNIKLKAEGKAPKPYTVNGKFVCKTAAILKSVNMQLCDAKSNEIDVWLTDGFVSTLTVDSHTCDHMLPVEKVLGPKRANYSNLLQL